MEYIDKYKLAYSYKEKKEYNKAIKIFKDLLDVKTTGVPKENIVFQIGGCCYFNNDFSEALSYFNNAQKLNDKDESISLGIYLSLIGLDKTKEAIKELSSFSEKFPIELYRDTIIELMEDIRNGIVTDFKDIVCSIKDKHNVSKKR